MLTLEQLKAICGNTSSCQTYYQDIGLFTYKYAINTPKRLAAFLAQVVVESGSFVHVVENLNYSATSLRKTFPTHFDDNQAIVYAHNPEKIANRIYANRYGNGDESSGDGWTYRGRGLIQLTFKNNYVSFANDIGWPPSSITGYLEGPKGIVHSAGWFWDKHGLNDLADKSLFVDITQKITGGNSSLAVREAVFSKALKILNV